MAAMLVGMTASAQPAKRRTTTSNAAAKKETYAASKKSSSTDRATLQFPASSGMPDDVVWKRDIYRQLDLLNDKNAPMY